MTKEDIKQQVIKQEQIKVQLQKVQPQKVQEQKAIVEETKEVQVATQESKLLQIQKIKELEQQLKLLTAINKQRQQIIKQFQQQKYNKLVQQNNLILSKLEVDEQSSNYNVIQSIKSDFIIPQSDDQKLTEQQINYNIKLYNTLSKANVFGQKQTKIAPIIPKTTEPVKTKIIDPRMENNPILR